MIDYEDCSQPRPSDVEEELCFWLALPEQSATEERRARRIILNTKASDGDAQIWHDF